MHLDSSLFLIGLSSELLKPRRIFLTKTTDLTEFYRHHSLLLVFGRSLREIGLQQGSQTQTLKKIRS